MKFLFIIFILCFYHISEAQFMDCTSVKPTEEIYDFHKVKQKRNKTVAWIFLGSGLLMTVSGLVVNSADEVVTNVSSGLLKPEEERSGDCLIYVGGATTLASIPFFISAGKHKRKASLSLKSQHNL